MKQILAKLLQPLMWLKPPGPPGPAGILLEPLAMDLTCVTSGRSATARAGK